MLQRNILAAPGWEVSGRVPSSYPGHTPTSMKVFPPLRPRVPVAACWQQSGRGAKNLPDDWLPIPQVHNGVAEKPVKQRTTTEENAAKKEKRNGNSASIQEKTNHHDQRKHLT